MHRNLWPGAVEAVPDGENSSYRLRLARFEMSALISTFLRRVGAGAEASQQEVQQLYASQGRLALACCPPERLRSFVGSPADIFETDRSDVYGLGVLAWALFVGPLPLEEPPDFSSPDAVSAWAGRFRERLGEGITQKVLPSRMEGLLRSMLDPDPRTRPSSSDLVERIARDYDAFLACWEVMHEHPHLVAFMPLESRETVYKWDWISHDPATQEGKEALAQFLVEDIRGASLVYSPSGAENFVGVGTPENLRRAQFVLLGRRGAWFCVPFQSMVFGQPGPVLSELLLIKYVTRLDKARSLTQSRFARLVSSVEAVDWQIGSAALDRLRQGRPSWSPLLEAVQVNVPRPAWQTTFEQAIDWFLDLQDVELHARDYPFVRDSGDGNASHAVLRYDPLRDQERIDSHRTPLFNLFASSKRRRPSFGDFFEDLRDDNGLGALQFRADDRGRPSWGFQGRAYFRRRLDDDHIEIKRANGAPAIPDAGWLRLEGDVGTETALRRQREVRPELLESRALLAQLHAPVAIKGLKHRWRDAGRGLGGGADAVVKDMLASQTFYALHGPPGTGKTTVTAHAVIAFLKAEPGARVLIAAQSNFALDNLALRVRKLLREERIDALALRVRSPSAEDKVDARLQDWDLDQLTARQAERIAAVSERRLGRHEDSDEVLGLLGEWKAIIRSSLVELKDRLRRGASLVFATCGTATRDKVDAVGSFGIYDWVIVEEAAKAWPTELAIPLVRGTRWTLIGDHRQLPAHRLDEVIEFLDDCAASLDPDLRAHGARREAYRQIFNLFGTLFAKTPATQQTPLRPGLASPLGQLSLQFRMREAIAEVVSRAFYPDLGGALADDGLPIGSLRTDPSTDVDSGLRAPPTLKGRALVWIDTNGVEDCADEGCWSNPGEARIIGELLAQMEPLSPGSGDESDVEPLAILTPYREQIDVLGRSNLPEGCGRRVFSVHELQGHEADIVVASLVRDKTRGTNPRRNLGHLAKPELVNVLFSRARRLLIVVGNFKHFHESGIDFWRIACEVVKRRGVILSARDDELFSGGG